MGQIRHGSATTTHAVRAAIQQSQASIAELSRERGSDGGCVPAAHALAAGRLSLCLAALDPASADRQGICAANIPRG